MYDFLYFFSFIIALHIYNTFINIKILLYYNFLYIVKILIYSKTSSHYKESLPIKMLNINYLQECICFGLKIGSKLCTIVSLYRSPSQSVYGIDYSKESISNCVYLRF